MFLLITALTTFGICACISKCRNTKRYIDFKKAQTFENFVIAKEEYGEYFVIHYMCKGKMYAYISKEHDYVRTPGLDAKSFQNAEVVFATFVTPDDNNFQVVTRKVNKFAGKDGMFYKWDEAPLFLRQKVLKAPKSAIGVRYITGGGEEKILSLREKEE